MRALAKLTFCLALLAGSVPLRAEAGQAPPPSIEVVRQYWAEAGLPEQPCTDCPDLPKAAFDYRWRSRPVKYVAFAHLRNRGRQAVRSIDLDFVFTDAAGVEFLRYRVRSERRIGVGKRVEIRHYIRDAKKESGYTPALPDDATLRRADNTAERLEVARVEYEDGSVWTRP